MKILIAEKYSTSRKFLSEFLSRYGECDLVVDGLEAINAYLIALENKVPYDLMERTAFGQKSVLCKKLFFSMYASQDYSIFMLLKKLSDCL